MRHALAVFLLCLPTVLSAQDQLQPSGVLSLAAQIHRPAQQFAQDLAEVAPQVRIRRARAVDVPGDPFLATLDAAFGAPGDLRPAGLIHCARYGIETRDLLAGRAASDPEIFPIVSALRVAGDDAQVWPEDAIALMRCSFAWDDARRISPWTEAEAAALIRPDFVHVTRQDDATIRASAGAHIRPQYGDAGFRLTGTDGPRESYYWVESLRVTRQVSHQRVVLRVFLLGGGV